MASMPIVLACGADDDFAMPLAVTLFSALTNLEKGTETVVYILDGGIGAANQRKIERVLRGVEGIELSIHWARPNLSQFQDLPLKTVLSGAMYLRLALPEIVSEDFDQVLYLDSDIIVQANLLELWRQETHGCALLAVRDYGMPYVSSPNCGLSKPYGSLGLEPDTAYFNSGVLLLDLRVWRAGHLVPAAFEFLHSHRDVLEAPDQDSLNAVVVGNWGQLDLRWNVQVLALFILEELPGSPFRDELRAKRKWLEHNAFILHFIGNPKPWQTGLRQGFGPLWVHYLRRSGWYSPVEYWRWYLRWLKDFVVGCFVRFYLHDVVRAWERLKSGGDL